MATNVNAQICVRRDTAANWSSANPTLLNGEVGYDTTNNKIKIGNGTLGWNALSYLTDSTGDAWPNPANKIFWSTDFLLSKSQVNNASYPQLYYSSPEYTWRSSNLGSTYFMVGAEDSPFQVNTGGHAGVALVAMAASNAEVSVGQCMPNTALSEAYAQGTALLISGTHEAFFIVQPGAGALPADASNDYRLYYGFWSSYGGPEGNQTRGVYFRKEYDRNGGRWQCAVRVRTGSSTSYTYWVDSGVDTGLLWTNLKFVVSPGTPSHPDSIINYWINGTLVATIDLATVNAYTGGGYLPEDIRYFTQATLATQTVSMGGYHALDYMHYLATDTRYTPPAINNSEA